MDVLLSVSGNGVHQMPCNTNSLLIDIGSCASKRQTRYEDR